jgi:nicotinamide-nucleotide amidase
LTLSSAGGDIPSAGILNVGDELLSGLTTNTNGTWLGLRLSELGFDVVWRAAVPDRIGSIEDGVLEALNKVDCLIVTGGLGPTPDDLTREGVAEALGLELVPHEDTLSALRERSRLLGMDRLPEGATRMALAPPGATLIPNPHGAAPGLMFEAAGRLVVLLPGVPREMRDIFSSRLESWLRDRFHGRLRSEVHRLVLTAGIPESRLAEEIGPLTETGPGTVSVAFLPHQCGVKLRLTARGFRDRREAEGWLDGVESSLEPVLGAYRYHAPTGDLAEALGMRLRSARKTLAVAESCTGGLLAKSLTDHPGSSEFLLGGVVAYSDAAKIGLLGVPRAVLVERGAVSRQVAVAMAQGVRERLGADAGIGITGVAGPGGGSPEKPVGTVWYAACLGGTTESRTFQFPGDREAIRARASWAAMRLLLRLMDGNRP